jgi:hypothetical protein
MRWRNWQAACYTGIWGEREVTGYRQQVTAAYGRNQKQSVMSLRDTPKHENRTSDNVERSLKPNNFVLFSGQILRFVRCAQNDMSP